MRRRPRKDSVSARGRGNGSGGGAEYQAARKVHGMKLSNTMVSAIVIGAVLVSAYAIGLVIREMRTGGQPAAPAAETTEATARPGPGTAAKDTPAQRAQVKEAKAETLEKMGTLTKEEQAQFQDKVIKQVGGRRGGRGPGGLTPEERQARKMKVQGPSKAGGEAQDANTPTPPKESTNPKQSAEKAGVTP